MEINIRNRCYNNWRCVLIMLTFIAHLVHQSAAEEVVCRGTSNGLSNVHRDLDEKMLQDKLRKQFENSEGKPCTYIDGNLELTHIRYSSMDLGFLQSIREVNGYVMIYQVVAKTIPLHNLTVIRSKTYYLNNGNRCALYVSGNENETDGLRHIDLSSLREIIIKDRYICITGNPFLCNMNTVDWGDILMDLNENLTRLVLSNNGDRGDCINTCNETCTNCWGPQATSCQTITFRNCDELCIVHGTRCAAPNDGTKCCDKRCAGGCSSIYNVDCISCQEFKMPEDTKDSKCVKECPGKAKYDQVTETFVTPEEIFYGMESRCVKECDPDYSIKELFCVKSCGEHFETTGDSKVCKPCGGACRKVCDSLHIYGVEGGLRTLSSTNIQNLEGCTIVDTFIHISFDGKDDLSSMEQFDYLKDIKRVRDYVYINVVPVVGDTEFLTSLEFLTNLEIIQGQHKAGVYALLIHNLPKLHYLGLRSLNDIQSGNVLISQTPELCYSSKEILENIVSTEGQVSFIGERMCSKPCDPECSEDSCWGPGPDMCNKCKNFILDGKCVAQCNTDNKLFESGGNTCEHCHPQCKTTCNGTLDTNCTSGCANMELRLSDSIQCVDNCPQDMYPQGNTCKNCHEYCSDDHGCTGNSNIKGDGGCRQCKNILRLKEDNSYSDTCMDPALTETEFKKDCSTNRNNFYAFVGYDYDYEFLFSICSACHSECVGCDDNSNSDCTKCRNYSLTRLTNNVCYSDCPEGYYADDMKMTCDKCHDECNGQCNGTTMYDCEGCKHVLKIDTDGLKYCADKCDDLEYYTALNNMCTSQCDNSTTYHDNEDGVRRCKECDPECENGCQGRGSYNCTECKHVIFNDECKATCPDYSELDKIKSICIEKPILGTGEIAGLVLALLCLLVTVICVIYFWHRRSVKKQQEKIKRQYSDIDATVLEPLNPSGVAPSQAQLRLIKETSLARHGELGSGAFGIVYKGIWTPQLDAIDGESNGSGVRTPTKPVKIPVAIKILNNTGSIAANKEFLDEAYVMATMRHDCLVRLLAVSMPAEQMMLITQLMPLGSLLDYLKTNKSKIGSSHLLTWCRQIATGMAYLEEKRLVHRDLAARNVLVQKPSQVKITDFGLAKVLDIGEDTFTSKGGKFPIRWLSLESLQDCTFTHQSDVWAFGVTIWETLTYGGKPFEGIATKDIVSHLVKGERLHQPPICTLEVYMLMLKCWMATPECRPHFIELEDDLVRMSNDPKRYLMTEDDNNKDELDDPQTSILSTYQSLIPNEDPQNLVDADDYLISSELMGNYDKADGGADCGYKKAYPENNFRNNSYIQTGPGPNMGDYDGGGGDYLVPSVAVEQCMPGGTAMISNPEYWTHQPKTSPEYYNYTGSTTV